MKVVLLPFRKGALVIWQFTNSGPRLFVWSAEGPKYSVQLVYLGITREESLLRCLSCKNYDDDCKWWWMHTVNQLMTHGTIMRVLNLAGCVTM